MKSPVVYMGLFLAAFGLYANELTKNKNPAPASKVVQTTVEGEAPVFPSARLDLFFKRLSAAIAVPAEPDGMKLSRRTDETTRVPSVVVSFQGEEVYAPGEQAMRETWLSLLDRIGELIQDDVQKGLHVEIRGFAEQSDDQERANTEFGKSAYAFSFGRAEWVAHSFARTHRLDLNSFLAIRGMGEAKKGRRVEVWFYYTPVL